MSKKNDKRYGTCQNPECMNYGVSDVIPADGNCPFCHTPMKPEEEETDSNQFDMLNDDDPLNDDLGSGGKTSKGGKGKIIGIIAAALVVVGGAGYGIYKLLSGPSEPKTIKLDKSKITMYVGDTVVITPKVEPEGAMATYVFKRDTDIIDVNDKGRIIALKAGNVRILVKCKENPDLKKICKININEKILNDTVKKDTTSNDIKTVEENVTEKKEESKGEKVKEKTSVTPINSNYGTVKLGYGIYTGELKNGKPHGHGTVKFNTTRRIVSSQDYVAHPGDRYEGDFRNGVISGGVGYWYHDGEVTGIRP